MINEVMLKALKLEYAPRSIIHISFHDKEFVFKSLTKKEYSEAEELSQDDDSLNDIVCQMALLLPDEDYFICEDEMAGLSQYIAPIIIEQSLVTNINDINNYLEYERSKVNSLNIQAFAMIKVAFPEVTKEKYDNMSWQEVLEYVALSEEIITMKQDIGGVVRNGRVKLSLIPLQDDSKGNDSNHEPTEEELIAEEKRETARIGMELYKQGIDPAIYFKTPMVERGNIIENPLLGGRHWDNEVRIYEIGKTIKRTQKSRRNKKKHIL